MSKIIVAPLIGLLIVNCYWKEIKTLGYRTTAISQNGLTWDVDVYDTYHENGLRSGPYRISISCKSSKRSDMEVVCVDSVIIKSKHNDSVVNIEKKPSMEFMGGVGGYPLIKSLQLPECNLPPNDLFLLVYYSYYDKNDIRKAIKLTFIMKYIVGKKYSNDFIDGCLSI